MREGPVCLIIPPSVFLLDERVFMPLGILKVAAVLEQKGIPVEMLDLSGIKNYAQIVRFYARSSQAVCFGVTATTPQMPAAVKIAAAIRSSRADAKLIIGGPHATLVNATYKNEQRKNRVSRGTRAMDVLCKIFDVVVAGDGEEAIFEAIKNNAPKIISADNPSSLLFLDNKRLDALPLPARHLIDLQSYKYSIDGKKALNIIAQLGCPFGCRFCGGRNSAFFRKVRCRSIENIVSEMSFMYKQYGAEGFMFYDDELNIGDRAIELMCAIKAEQDRLGVDWRLRGFVRASLFNEQQAIAMYNAGLRWLLVGFESGSAKILENMDKKTSVAQNTRCVEIAHEHGLKVKALMCIGHPGESRETVMETRDWLLGAKPDDFDITIITAYPGSAYYDDAVLDSEKGNIWVYAASATGDRLYEIDVDFTKAAQYFKGTPGDYHSYVFTDHLSAEDLVKLRDLVEQDVRRRLRIPFYAAGARSECRICRAKTLPPYILRKTR